MSKYLLFSFSFLFIPFFLDFAGCNLFFLLFSALLLFLFFLPFFFLLLELSCFFFFFLSFLLGAPHFFLIVFGVELLSCFFFFWGPCVFSLSLLLLNKPLEIDPMFLAVYLKDIPSRNHAMNDMPSSGTKYIYVTYPYMNMCEMDIFIPVRKTFIMFVTYIHRT